jgi:hypothetical protein
MGLPETSETMLVRGRFAKCQSGRHGIVKRGGWYLAAARARRPLACHYIQSSSSRPAARICSTAMATRCPGATRIIRARARRCRSAPALSIMCARRQRSHRVSPAISTMSGSTSWSPSVVFMPARSPSIQPPATALGPIRQSWRRSSGTGSSIGRTISESSIAAFAGLYAGALGAKCLTDVRKSQLATGAGEA